MMTILALLVQSPTQACQYDRTAMIALDPDAFDQDMEGGWRSLENRGCEKEAADLIRDWRIAHKSNDYLLFWHEGQLRADINQTSKAITLFKQSFKPTDQDRGSGWNLYVEGTIAFLNRDRSAFDNAKRKLASLPRPANFSMQGPDGKPIPVKWPLNLNVLEGLERCWAKPYKAAYDCATPLFRATAVKKR